MKLLEVECPMCDGKLWIDLEEGVVVKHKTKSTSKMDLELFLDKQKSRSSELDELFKRSEKENSRRKELLEDEFIKAKDNPDSIEGEYISPFDLD